MENVYATQLLHQNSGVWQVDGRVNPTLICISYINILLQSFLDK